MGNNIADNDWTFEAPFLASLPKENPFSVPEGYFDELSNSINNAVFIDNLRNKVDHSGFTTPEFYFDELNNQIESKIAITKLKEALSNSDGFDIPSGYFNQLSDKILAKTTAIKPERKIIKLWHSDALKYATAACFILISAIGLYFNQQHKAKQKLTAEVVKEQMLYDIDETTIIEHVQLQEHTNKHNTTSSDNSVENYILNNYSTNDLTSEF